MLRTLLLRMLRRDHDLRLSVAVQSRYRACGDDPIGKEAVTRRVQLQVAREAGFASCVVDAVELLQSAMSLFPDDEEMGSAAFYLKNNIHVPCSIAVGSQVPYGLELHDLTPSAMRGSSAGGAGALSTKGHGSKGHACTLGELISGAPLTVLCAGSAT